MSRSTRAILAAAFAVTLAAEVELPVKLLLTATGAGPNYCYASTGFSARRR